MDYVLLGAFLSGVALIWQGESRWDPRREMFGCALVIGVLLALYA